MAKKVKTKAISKKSATTGFRLSDAQKKQIIDAPETMTLAQIAEKFSTSVNTVAKYRSGAASTTKVEKTPSVAPASSKRGRPLGTTNVGSSGKGVSLEIVGSLITIRGDKSNPLLKNLVKEILA